MKKILGLFVILLTIGSTAVFAKGKGKSFAIGAQAGYPLGGAVTFKVQTVPCVFALDFSGNSDGMNLGLTADWWISNPTITGTWGYYYGLGLYAGLGLGGESFGFAAAPRLLIGTNVFCFDNFLELYLQGGWEPTLYISDSGLGTDFLSFFANLGFRFWF